MNTIQCPRCGFQNQAGLAFCTNCGNQLSAPPPQPSMPSYPAPSVQPAAQQQQFGQPQSFSPPAPAKGSTGRNLALFGGIGCLALLLLGVAGIGGLYYLGSGKKTTNVSVNATGYNNSLSNSRSFNSSSNSTNSNSGGLNSNSNSNSGSGSDVDATMSRMMPPQIGAFKLQSSSAGNPEKDFPGAEKTGKATYAKGSKKVDVVIASFDSAATAKTKYAAFLQGFKSIGARILNQQKVKDKSGAESGEAAIYTYSGAYEGMFYNETYGARITTSDLNTLSEFATAFGSYFE